MIAENAEKPPWADVYGKIVMFAGVPVSCLDGSVEHMGMLAAYDPDLLDLRDANTLTNFERRWRSRQKDAGLAWQCAGE